MEGKRFSDMYPDIKGIFKAECIPADEMNALQKQTYTARLLVVLSGDATFFANGQAYAVSTGGVLYMPPHQLYSTVFRTRFVVRQICFDFFPYRSDDAPYTQILIGDAYDPRFMGAPVRFLDTDVFGAPFVTASQPALLSTAMTLWKEYEERRIGYQLVS